MGTSIKSYIDRFRHDRHQRLVLGSVLLVLAIMVTLVVYWQLRYTGITMTNETYCGYEEHIHTDECYELTLICGLEESEGHTHTDKCYEEQQVLVCTLEESEGHTHNESCYDEEGNLTCTIEESEGHVHTDECYETQLVLACGLEEYEGHTHTDECYEKTLICGMEEHTHTVECLVDLNADVEDATVWEATLPALTNDLRTDVVNIAYSQLGYTESTANYTLAEDGTTHNGYTRYGAWYGSAYANWESMFVAFCLDYAGIADEFTYNAGAYAWSIELTNLGYYQTVESYSPLQGDVVFIDTDSDGKADISAIVISVDETSSTITVIQGNYAVTDSEGITADTVSLVTYSTATTNELTSLSANAIVEITPTILGYANISPETVSEEETASEEIEEVVEEETVEEESSEVESEPIEELTEEPFAVEEPLETGDEPSTEITASEEETGTEEGTTLLTSTSTDYVTQVTELYTLAMSLTSADTSTAATIWDGLMQIWEQIYAEEESGTLTLTTEEYDNVNTLTDEVYYYFVETVGYDPYGVMTLEEEQGTGSLTATNVSQDLSAVSNVNVTASTVTYDGSTDTFDFHLYITFENLSASNITDVADNTFYLYLPDGVEILDMYRGNTYTGYDTKNSSTEAFKYSFEQDSEGNWYVVIKFTDGYVSSLTNSQLVDGYVQFDVSVSEEYVEDDGNGNVIISSTGDLTITIDSGEITNSDPGENWLADVHVTKSASSYDSESGTITYKVIIWSENGTTGTISLSDLISITNNSTYSNTDITVDDITDVSVTYYALYGWGTPYDNYWLTNAVVKLSDSDYTLSTSGGELSIVLPALNGYTDAYASTGINYEGDCYVVEYTVNLNTTSAEYNSSVLNSATATTDTTSGTLIDTGVTSTSVVSHVVSKTGSYSSTTGEITWTITLNPNNANIAGYVLSDIYLSQAIDGSLTITNSAGTADPSEYTLNTTNSVIDSITFNATNGSENTNAYTITYKTAASSSLGDSTTYEANEVTVTDGTTEISEDSATVTVSGGGSIYKTYTSADTVYTKGTDSYGNDIYTRDVTWTTNIAVPLGGISVGTSIEDYIGTYSGDTSTYIDTSTGWSGTAQWFTYAQITDFFNELVTNGITIGSNTVHYSNGANFRLEAYSTTNGWLTYEQLVDTSNTYTSDVFTQYKITFLNAVEYTGTLTLTYETTVDITPVVTESSTTAKYYYNTAKVNNLKYGATYTEYDSLLKYDGNLHQGTTSTEIDDDGNLTWIVKAYIYPGSTDDYTLTDTIPEGLSFVSAAISVGNNLDSATMTINGTGNYTSTLSNSKSEIAGSVTTGADSSTSLALVFDKDDYKYIQSSGGYITVTYTVHIDGFDSSKLNGYSYTENSDGSKTYTINSTGYTNTAELSWGGVTETETQTQTVTYTEENAGSTPGTTGHDTVDKSGKYNQGDSTIAYQVLINIDETELNNGSPMTFTDIAKCYYYEPYGTVLTLEYASVKFYQLLDYNIEYDSVNDKYSYINSSGETVEVNKSDIYIFNDGNTTVYYYMSELDIAWTYDESTSSWTTSHTITATVPDSTAILMEYSYNVYAGGGTGATYTVNNSATLTGNDGEEGTDDDYSSETYYEPTTSGGVNSESGITIYKVDEGNYSSLLSGAKFAFYKYDEDNPNADANGWVRITADDYKNPTSENDETLSAYSGPMDENNYLTTEDGAIYISNGVVDSNVLYLFSWYEADTIYKIVEVQAAEGHVISEEEVVYFYWASSTGATYTVPKEFNAWEFSAYNLNSSSLNEVVFVENAPITTFTLNKVSSSDNSTTIPGATFALYVYKETDSEGKDIWVKIGTYTTDKNGQISITYDEELYSFNRAYKLTEVTTADGYNIAWEDVTEFYFWWSSDDNYTYAPNLPSDWDDPSSAKYSVVYDISHESTTVTATNTETSTTIEVTKVWIDENGNVEENSAYTANVQLYYYLMAEDGTMYDLSSATSATELITLTTTTGTTATSTVELFDYSDFLSSTITISGYDYIGTIGYGTSIRKTFLDALFNDDYTDSYVELEIVNLNSASNLSFIIQAGGTTSYGGSSGGYDVVASISGGNLISTYNSGTAEISVVRYSISELRSKLESSTIVQNYMTMEKCDFETAVRNLFNTVFLQTSATENATVSSFKVVASAATLDTDSGTGTFPTSYNWSQWFSGKASEVLTDGAVLQFDYTCTNYGNTSNQIQLIFGIQYTDSNVTNKQLSTTLTIAASSGTISVPVSTILNGAEITASDCTSFVVCAMGNIWASGYGIDGFEGTISNVQLLIPASSTTTTKTYSYAVTNSYSKLIENNEWNTFLSRDECDWNSELYSSYIEAIGTEGAVIYISYTCSSDVPSSLTVGIQYAGDGSSTENWQTAGSVSITSLSSGTNTIAIPVSEISSSLNASNYNCIYLQVGSDDVNKITINSVSILLPYSLTESVSGTVVSTNYTVTLYDPVLGGASGNGSVYIENTGTSTWNAISSGESEPEYNYSNVDDTENDLNLFTGYGFLDAIYANLASEVQITVTDVDDATEASLLSKLQLIIQGDKSANIINTDGYDAIATVSPSKVTASGDSYVLTYQVSDILNALKSYNANYTTAAAVFADYNALIMAVSGSDPFSATVTDLKVVSSTINTASDTYTLSSLVGYEYGAPYTDSTHPSGYVFTLDSDNDWTVAVANLPLTMTISGKTYDIYYYFVETSYVGGSVAYTTTYSQREGENGGGEIVITNVATTYVLPSTGVVVDYQKLYEFGVMLILLALFGAGAYRNISHIRNILVREPRVEKAPHGCRRDQRPRDVRFRKFVIPRTIRKGDTRAGPDDAG